MEQIDGGIIVPSITSEISFLVSLVTKIEGKLSEIEDFVSNVQYSEADWDRFVNDMTLPIRQRISELEGSQD